MHIANRYCEPRTSQPAPTRCAAVFYLGLLCVLFVQVDLSQAQVLNARRLGMGGVVTSDNRSQAAANVAFRAVPKGRSVGNFPLPFGLIQFATDLPVIDSDDDDFNFFELVNEVMNPPFNVSLGGPKEVSSDIGILVSKNSLLIDLQDLQRIVPDDALVGATVHHFSGVGADIGPVFLHAYPLIHVRSSLDVSNELRVALGEGVAIEPNTTYRVMADARAQTAIAIQADITYLAFHDHPSGEEIVPIDPRRDHSTALYLGVGPKCLIGLAFGDTEGDGTAVTGDILFAPTDPLAFELDARTRYAHVGGDGGMGAGYGADLGAVFFWDNFELGLGLNDVAAEIHWEPTVKQHRYDDEAGKFVSQEIARGERFTARVPLTTVVNVAKRIGNTTLAAAVVDTEVRATLHAGLEYWFGRHAARGGCYRDQNKLWQVTAGAGKRFGSFGLDLAIATHSRNIVLEREVELSLSISRY
ncbi:hypothetical protein ACFLQW_02430 [Candidatus Zixiibacteriota bacterium]